MNEERRELGASDLWAGIVKDQMLHWVLDGINRSRLRPDVIEVGPGPGRTTDVIRTLTDRVTAVELDDDLAAQLTDRSGAPTSRSPRPTEAEGELLHGDLNARRDSVFDSV